MSRGAKALVLILALVLAAGLGRVSGPGGRASRPRAAKPARRPQHRPSNWHPATW
jgi:hypothetical protein